MPYFKYSYLFWVVIDELPVDEDIDVVVADQINFVLHLLLLGQLNLCHLLAYKTVIIKQRELKKH